MGIHFNYTIIITVYDRFHKYTFQDLKSFDFGRDCCWGKCHDNTERTLFENSQNWKSVCDRHLVGKKVTGIFSFPHNVYYSIKEEFQFFLLNLVCPTQMLSIRISLKFCHLVKS